MPVCAGIYYSLHARSQIGTRSLTGIAPVMLLHGAGGSHLSWPAEIRRLSGLTILAVDLPGHGRSSGLGYQSIEAYAVRLVKFLDDIGVYRAVLVGHSMGAAIALQIAIQQPDRITALGLVAGGACMAVPAELVQNLSHKATVLGGYSKLEKSLFAADTRPQLVKEYVDSLQDERAGILYGDWMACSEYDLRRQITQVRCPCYVLVGEEDQITPLAGARFIQSHHPQTEVQVIPKCGHMAHLEAPDAVGRGLQDFLEQETISAQTRRAAE